TCVRGGNGISRSFCVTFPASIFVIVLTHIVIRPASSVEPRTNSLNSVGIHTSLTSRDSSTTNSSLRHSSPPPPFIHSHRPLPRMGRKPFSGSKTNSREPLVGLPPNFGVQGTLSRTLSLSLVESMVKLAL